MAQHDYDIANDTAANVRADINNVLEAIVSNNSGASEPATTYANQWWYDSSNDILKIRSEDDTAWIDVGYVDQSGGLFKLGYENEPTVYTTSDTYTPTAGARYALIKMKGAGAAGGGAAVTATGTLLFSTGSGGGEGGEIIGVIDLSTISSATLTIGAKGTGVSGAAGNDGGDTVWDDGTNVWTAEGGIGGGTASGVNNSIANPGVGGGTTATGATPLVRNDGESGVFGFFFGSGITSSPIGIGGNGGRGPSGLRAFNTSGQRDKSGVNADRKGAGGSGAACLATNGTPSRPGGDGDDGFIEITEFF